MYLLLPAYYCKLPQEPNSGSSRNPSTKTSQLAQQKSLRVLVFIVQYGPLNLTYLADGDFADHSFITGM